MKLWITLLILTGFTLGGCAATKPMPTSKTDFYLEQYRASKQSPPRATEETALKELERAGDMSVHQGELQTALLEYEKALLQNPESARLHYKKGVLLLAGKQFANAVKELLITVKLDPNYVLAHLALGQTFFQSGNFDQAKIHLKKVITLDSLQWRAYDLLGVIHDYQKNYILAQDAFHAAILIDPEKGQLYNNLAVSLALTGKHDKALTNFMRALGKGYKHEKVYNNIGLMLAQLGRYSEALDWFKKTGSAAEAYNNLGCVYLKQGKYQRADVSFQKAIEIKPEFYILASENRSKARITGNTTQIP